MIKRIPLKSLKPGMYVSSFDLSWFKHPFVSTRLGIVRDQSLIDELRHLGVAQVEIDTSRCAQSAEPAEEAPEASFVRTPQQAVCPPASDPERTAKFAKKLFDQSILVTKALMGAVSRGAPVNIEELRPCIGSLIDSVNKNENVLHVIVSLKSYDDYAYTHSLNLAALGVLLGDTLDLDSGMMEQLGMAGILHDVGMHLLPREIVTKSGLLTPMELEEIRRHPQMGFERLRRQGGIPDAVLRAVLEHHERLDGAGYPLGLAGNDIHPISSIIGIVDVYDALTSDRRYRSRISPHMALRTLFNLRGQAFPDELVDSFIKRLGVYPAFSVVQLRNGFYALVTRQTPGKPLYPEVTVFCDSDQRPVVKRKVDTWRLCGELSRKEFEVARPVEPDELPAPMATGII